MSLWILYHLVGILIMPSPQSILVKNWAWFFRPYLNALTINTTWNLFSPDPATAGFMNVQMVSQEFETGVKEFTWPRMADQKDRDPRFARELYFMRYMVMNENHIKNIVIPEICKQDKSIQEVSLRFYTTVIPSLEVASTDRWNRASSMKRLVEFKLWQDMCPYESQNILDPEEEI